VGKVATGSRAPNWTGGTEDYPRGDRRRSDATCGAAAPVGHGIELRAPGPAARLRGVFGKESDHRAATGAHALGPGCGAGQLRAAAERRAAPAFGARRHGGRRRIRKAYAMTEYAAAKTELEKIFRQLERMNPSAAHSLEEGLEETLARWRSAAALDRDGVIGSREEVPQSQRLPRSGNTAAQTESLVDSSGPSRVTCVKWRAAAIN
jgi:hypothetical protein